MWWKIFSIKDILDMDTKSHIKLIGNFMILIIAVPFFIMLFSTLDIYTAFNIINKSDVKIIFDVMYDYIMIISVIFIFIQVCVVRMHEQGRIDLSKEHKALDLIKEWNNAMTPEVNCAKSIVEKLNFEEARKVMDKEPIEISKSQYEIIKNIIACGMESGKSNEDDIDVAIKNENKQLSVHEVILLRTCVIKYLNTLELVLCAWLKNSVNREIIESEFEYLVQTDRTGGVVLENFRKAAGENNYPGINNFCRHVREKNIKSMSENNVKG